MKTEELILAIDKAHAIAAQKRMPFQPTEHGYSNYQDGCLAMKEVLLSMLTNGSEEEVPEIFPGTRAALDRLMPNAELSGPRPLAAEGLRSNAVLGAGGDEE